MEQQLLELAQYGIGGVAIALICLIAYLAKMVKELISNHIQHNTETMENLQQTINELCIYLKSLNGRLKK
jgi:uncharacterized protein YoxC